jgi:hypothetical protein
VGPLGWVAGQWTSGNEEVAVPRTPPIPRAGRKFRSRRLRTAAGSRICAHRRQALRHDPRLRSSNAHGRLVRLDGTRSRDRSVVLEVDLERSPSPPTRRTALPWTRSNRISRRAGASYGCRWGSKGAMSAQSALETGGLLIRPGQPAPASPGRTREVGLPLLLRRRRLIVRPHDRGQAGVDDDRDRLALVSPAMRWTALP